MPDGSERAHQLVIDDRRARVEQGRGTAPDVVLETDLDAARELALGTINAQHALAAGRLRVSGTIEALVEHGDALRALDDIFRGVRAQTTFAPGGTSTVASAP